MYGGEFMKKVLLFCIIPLSLYSCHYKEISNKALQLEEELKKARNIIEDYENSAEVPEPNDELSGSETKLIKVSEDYAFDEYLVYDGKSLIPNGYTITKGYLSIMTAEKAGITEFEMEDGYIFYITEKQNTLVPYLKKAADRKIFFQEDAWGNPGLTVHVASSDIEGLLVASNERPVNVILTLHDIFPMGEPIFVPFAVVYPLQQH